VIYLVAFIIVFLSGVGIRITVKNAKKRKLLLLFSSLFVVFLVFALKNPLLGADSTAYYSIYSKLGTGEYSLSRYSPWGSLLFYFVMFLFSKMHIPFAFYLICYYLASLSLIGYFIYKTTDDADFFILGFLCSYLFPFSFVVLREFLALSILMAGLPFLFKRNTKGLLAFCLALLFASLNHLSALVGLILIPLVYFDNKTIKLVDIFLICVAFFLANSSIIFFVSDYGGLQYKASNLRTPIKHTLITFSIMVSTYLLTKTNLIISKKRAKDELITRELAISQDSSDCLFNISFLCSVFIFLIDLSLFFNESIYRLNIYFLFPLIATYSSLYKKSKIKNPYLKYCLLVFVAGIGLYFFSTLFQASDYQIWPFRFFWEAV